jgi:uncharacterized protein (DUF1015 family)
LFNPAFLPSSVVFFFLSQSKIYDRSVCSGDDCLKTFNPTAVCKCFVCSEYPIVIVSSGDTAICDKYNITSKNIKEYLDGGLLEPVEEESLMIYGQEDLETGRMQIGILASLSVEDCLQNVVKKHEMCLSEETTKANLMSTPKLKLYQSHYVDPIMIMYRNERTIDDIIQKITACDDPISLKDENRNMNHYIWSVKEQDVSTTGMSLSYF